MAGEPGGRERPTQSRDQNPGAVPGRERGRAVWVLSAAGLACVAGLVLFANGCRSKPDYPANLTFPSRADRLVLKVPDKPPPGPNAPGKLDEELAALDAAGGKTALPPEAPADARTALDAFLKESFGTPAGPKVSGASEVNAAAERLGLTGEKLTEGGKLFRRHCQQCHGLTGDGRGESGLWVNPFPRDFRRGLFKFVSSGEGGKPRHADLVRTISVGLKGTAMPSFGQRSQAERDLLARYVAYLSTRGETEFQTLASHLGGDPNRPAAARVGSILAEWEKAQQAPALPEEPDDGEPGSPAHADAVRRGVALFTAKADNSCVSCHGDFGRKPVLRYSAWGTVATPADLTSNNAVKGGDRPEDVFARVRFGIKPVGMPAHPELTERQVWDLVRLVRSLPYPRELPEDVRAAVYPKS